MSPGSPEQQWTLEGLQKIARSALWFESAFEVILPHSRRGNWFARSNKIENCLLRDLTFKECFEWIGKCQTINQLVWLMCPWDFGSQNPAPMTFPQEDRRVVLRLYGWNFANLDDLPDNKGTIGTSATDVLNPM